MTEVDAHNILASMNESQQAAFFYAIDCARYNNEIKNNHRIKTDRLKRGHKFIEVVNTFTTDQLKLLDISMRAVVNARLEKLKTLAKAIEEEKEKNKECTN